MELRLEDEMMRMEKSEADTHTMWVQAGRGGPTGLKPRSQSSAPGRDCKERSTMGPLWVFGVQSWFAKNAACHSPASPRRAAAWVFVSCSWRVTHSHLGLWLGAARACSFSS